MKVMTSDALVTFGRIDARNALISMEVKTIVAFPVADLVKVRLALLLAERHKGRHHEEASDQAGDEPQSHQVFYPHICRMLDSLLQVYTLVHVAAEHADLEHEPGTVDDCHDLDSLVQCVLRFVQLCLVVEEEQGKRHLMQDKLLTEADVQIVCLDLTQ